MIEIDLPEHWLIYVVCAILASVVIRFILSFLRWTERSSKSKPKLSFRALLLGFGAGENSDDYLHPFIVGCLELLVYPLLLAAGDPEFIGAWLGLKVLPKLGAWSTQRETYQRFLIGNALVIISSFFLARWFYE